MISLITQVSESERRVKKKFYVSSKISSIAEFRLRNKGGEEIH